MTIDKNRWTFGGKEVWGMLVVIVLLLPSLAWGQTEPGLEISQTGVTITASYLEPTTSLGGVALDDLASTEVRIFDGESELTVMHTPATSPQGGGQVTVKIPIDLPRGQVKDVRAVATATDIKGNVSDPVEVTFRVDHDPPGQVRKAN